MPRVPRVIVSRKQRVQNVGVNALARECDLPQTTVSQLMSRGKTADEIRAYAAVRHGEPMPPPKPASTQADGPKSDYEVVLATRARNSELEEAKLRRAMALAEKQEIENLARRGELVPLAQIEHWIAQCLVGARDEIKRLPSEFADILAAESEPLKVRQILTVAMDRLMNRLAALRRTKPDEEKVA